MRSNKTIHEAGTGKGSLFKNKGIKSMAPAKKRQIVVSKQGKRQSQRPGPIDASDFISAESLGPVKINKKYTDEISSSKEFKEIKFDTYDLDLLSKV